jgi:hypothetical protein
VLIDQWTFILILSSIIGGGIGAQISEVAAWKGALIASLASIVAILIAIFVTANGLVTFISSMIVVGVSGGAFKLTGNQNITVFLGMLLGSGAAFFIADLGR